MGARIIEVRDAVAAKIARWWEPVAPDGVLTPWDLDGHLDTAKMRGRRVFVLPSGYTGEPASRSEDRNDYTIVVLVAEVFRDQGRPPDPWVSELVAWCEELLGLIGDARGPRLLAVEGAPDSGLWPQAAECTTVFDLEELSERKLFLSVLTLTFRENAEA